MTVSRAIVRGVELDLDALYVLRGAWQELRWAPRWDTTVGRAGDGYWFDETPRTTSTTVGASTGWYVLDEDGVEGDTICAIDTQALVTRTGPATESWLLTPRVLPEGRWTVRTELGAVHRFDTSFEQDLVVVSHGGWIAYWPDDLESLRPGDVAPTVAKLLSPLAVGFPLHLQLRAAPTTRPSSTADVVSITRTRTETGPRW